jgi:hypothetical protein
LVRGQRGARLLPRRLGFPRRKTPCVISICALGLLGSCVPSHVCRLTERL